jgi:hypothetical protein
MLIAYTPPGTAGPYAERGPVFVHLEPCGGYPTPDRYPPALSHRRQVVRAYDHDGRIADGVLVPDGVRARAVITDLLTQSDVALVHLRNVEYGCYNFAVRRHHVPAVRQRTARGRPSMTPRSATPATCQAT